jgi:hypothetical protein
MTEENITVVVRLRPLSQKEQERGAASAWKILGPTTIADQTGGREFLFDRVYAATQRTEGIFEELGEKVVWGVMEGYNGCMFCYGQTGSGKTHTMHGVRPKNPGIVPLSIETIFAFIHETCDREFLVRCSYLEIYNECVNDLLNPDATSLTLREDKHGGLKIIGLSEKECCSINQIYSLLALGDANRQVASTNFNMKSSRSHSM